MWEPQRLRILWPSRPVIDIAFSLPFCDENASVRGKYKSGHIVSVEEAFVQSDSDKEMGDTRKKRQQTFRKSLLSFVKLKHIQTLGILNFIPRY
jgi:hypothetical protein